MAADRTETRRKRVKELWGRPSRALAKILLEEGFEVACSAKPRTKPAIEKWETKRIDAMRRNVDNDREWWREELRKRLKTPRTLEEHSLLREEHVLSLESDLEEIDEMLYGDGAKATARAILIGEKRQTRVALAKARGVETLPEAEGADGDDGPVRPAVLVYVVDNENSTAETRAAYGLDSGGGNSNTS